MVLLPFFGFTWSTFGKQTGLAVGLMIIAAAPGGATSNLLTAFAKGTLPLDIFDSCCKFTVDFYSPSIMAFSHKFLWVGNLDRFCSKYP